MLSDIRYAFRSLGRTPGFTAVVVLSFALGIAATSTVVCWMGNLLLDPIPGSVDQGELVILKSNNGGGNISVLDARDFAALGEVFAGGEVSQIGPVYMEGQHHADWIYAQVVSPNFFDLLGVKPIFGRGFLPGEGVAFGDGPVVVISEALWRRRFDASGSVIGRKIEINRHPVTIIGVAPAGFVGSMTGVSFDCWAPLGQCGTFFNYDRSYLDWRGSRAFHNLFRLKPGVTIAQAQAAVNAVNARLDREYPRSNQGAEHQVLALADAPYGAQWILLPALRLMLCVSALVLLIVCSNVANLLLSRAVRRSKETAIRLATGASRLQVVRLFVVESLILALLGGCGGLLLTFWTVGLLGALIPGTDLPANLLNFGINPVTVLFIAGLSIFVGVGVGLVPAFQFSARDVGAAIKDGGRSSVGAAHHRVRKALVMAEVALSIVLLVCAALCIKGMRKAATISPGFNPDGVLLGSLNLGSYGYSEAQGKVFCDRLLGSLEKVPGVKAASLASFYPLGFSGCKGTDASVSGRARPVGEDPTCERTLVSPHFFDTLGMTLVEGRDFNDSDDASSPRVVIINQALARRFWPGQDPLGRVLRSQGADRTVVGVVRNIAYYHLGEAPRVHLYFPYRQGVPELDLGVSLRTGGDPLRYAAALRKAVTDIDPRVDVRQITTLREYAMAATYGSRVASFMLTLMGLVALVLAAMGIYAVMAYAVSQRISEFGIRMALGAGRRDIVRLVLGQGIAVVGAGIAIGLVAALLVTRLLSGFLYGVSPFDVPTFAGVVVLLAIVALVACVFPALRATRVDPVQALRTD